ncbi:hypothetical protein [Hyalangium sp.]|uniref:hypothetical protein n=1 Tax=Hyalangium sp. TaxID=2028555 RepID=UPI002D51850A|nr:hypothetical protein [Hyalangium sp.]HYH99440.1 hypothetical protein [Hyalangium sp.]
MPQLLPERLGAYVPSFEVWETKDAYVFKAEGVAWGHAVRASSLVALTGSLPAPTRMASEFARVVHGTGGWTWSAYLYSLNSN